MSSCDSFDLLSDDDEIYSDDLRCPCVMCNVWDDEYEEEPDVVLLFDDGADWNDGRAAA